MEVQNINSKIPLWLTVKSFEKQEKSKRVVKYWIKINWYYIFISRIWSMSDREDEWAQIDEVLGLPEDDDDDEDNYFDVGNVMDGKHLDIAM